MFDRVAGIHRWFSEFQSSDWREVFVFQMNDVISSLSSAGEVVKKKTSCSPEKNTVRDLFYQTSPPQVQIRYFKSCLTIIETGSATSSPNHFLNYYLKQLQSVSYSYVYSLNQSCLYIFFLHFLSMFIIFAQNNPPCRVLIGFPHGWMSSVQTLRAEWPSIAGFNLLTGFFFPLGLSFYFEGTGLSVCYFVRGLGSLGAFWHDCCKSWGE